MCLWWVAVLEFESWRSLAYSVGKHGSFVHLLARLFRHICILVSVWRHCQTSYKEVLELLVWSIVSRQRQRREIAVLLEMHCCLFLVNIDWEQVGSFERRVSRIFRDGDAFAFRRILLCLILVLLQLSRWWLAGLLCRLRALVIWFVHIVELHRLLIRNIGRVSIDVSVTWESALALQLFSDLRVSIGSSIAVGIVCLFALLARRRLCSVALFPFWPALLPFDCSACG